MKYIAIRLENAPRHFRCVVLEPVDFRVPVRGELYLGHDLKVHRLKQDRVQSRRAKPRLILIESRVEGETATR